ncbi:SH3 domain-containing protein [Aggregatilinea lenta]|uniref:SH3 domain-containing protein n=1 Tax=Aggregatilinea lenta TaxID=913108 RepID=UPI000E5AE67B|nr:SH3 domain-containing protein [Aggregatilinea lenta]
MQKRPWWTLLLLICLIVLVTACESDETQTPSPQAQSDAALNQPTRTVKPIVSFTPRFTATPLPSTTPFPSSTPRATETLAPPTPTLSPTPSPTPTASGIIRSNQSVNLRDGPGSDQPVVTAVAPGTDVAVLRSKEDDSGATWYEVAVEDDDGNEQRLWVHGSLIDTNYDEIVSGEAFAAEVSDTQVAEDDDTTPSTPSGPTRTPGATPVPGAVNVLAYCTQKAVRPPTPTTNDDVVIEWSWYVANEDLMQQHLDNANYEVTLDDKPLLDWDQYATEIRREAGRWIVYWYYPVGHLEAGEHTITYHLTWNEAITDGYGDFGPGTGTTANDGSCMFTVTEAEQ